MRNLKDVVEVVEHPAPRHLPRPGSHSPGPRPQDPRAPCGAGGGTGGVGLRGRCLCVGAEGGGSGPTGPAWDGGRQGGRRGAGRQELRGRREACAAHMGARGFGRRRPGFDQGPGLTKARV